MQANDRLTKQMDAYKRLLRVHSLSKGDLVAPQFLYANCGVYSEYQARSFCTALEKAKWTHYIKDSDAFEVLRDRY
jgi:hypothetical protein